MKLVQPPAARPVVQAMDSLALGSGYLVGRDLPPAPLATLAARAEHSFFSPVRAVLVLLQDARAVPRGALTLPPPPVVPGVPLAQVAPGGDLILLVATVVPVAALLDRVG